MTAKANPPLIPLERVDNLLQLEPFLVILSLAIGAWLIYWIFLRKVSAERHRNLQRLFRNLGFHLISTSLLYFAYFGLTHFEGGQSLERVTAYVGLLTLFEGALLFIKASKILIFEYLFLGHMQVAVPLLLVNIFTLLFSIGIGIWMISEIFAIRLAPLLATSAAFTLVLGLALQETLGNLFAGIALQLDKPYEIGDWVEINASGQKWIGQVYEISWRATVLIGYGNEQISVPNRILGQAQVSNYAHRPNPIARNQVFRLPFGADVTRVKKILMETILAVPGVSREVEPLVLLSETTESWVTFKVIYYISDFGLQYVVADEVLSAALGALKNETIPLAPQRLLLVRENEA